MNCDPSGINFQVENANCWVDALLNHGNSIHQRKTAAFDFVCQNIMEIIKTDHILQLDIESFKNLLRSDNLAVTSEEVVFELVKRWLDFNNINPYDSLDSLLEVVRSPFINPEYFLTEVMPFAAPITKCMFYIQEALRWHLFPNQRDKLSKLRTTLRKGKSANICRMLVVGSDNVYTSARFELYDFEEKKWTQLKRLEIKKRNYAVALVENEILLIGGHDTKLTDSVLSVNLMNGSISNLNPLNDARYNVRAVVVGEGKSSIVYVAGGRGSARFNTVERWDPITRQWSRLASMKEVRECCGLAHYDGNLYAAGGKNDTVFHKSLEMYNIQANTWTMKAPMNHARSYCTLAATKEYIYAVGGHDANYGAKSAINTVERYDPRMDTWTILANISANGTVGAIGIENNVFVVGGFSSNVVEMYDASSKQWKKLASMNMNRALSTVIPLPCYLSDYKFNW